jgi:GNAT superfamily N-acetyltransferase
VFPTVALNNPVSPDPGADIIITDIVGDEMVQVVSEIHLEAFRGYLNARLGTGYACALIRWFSQQKGAVALAAFDRNRQAIGYAIGASPSLAKTLQRDLAWITARSIVLRPWLIFDKRLWKVGYARLVKKKDADNVDGEPELPEPTMSLFGIGVKSSHRRKGVGQQLLRVFEERAKALKHRSLLLWVYTDKVTTRHLYERCGWRPCSGSLESTGVIKYVRLLDTHSS